MLYNIIKCDIVILQKGKKGMKFEEYLEKRTNVDKYILKELKDEIGFCELNWLHKTEKVEISPVEKINEMSKKIKENPSVLRELIVKCGISDF